MPPQPYSLVYDPDDPQTATARALSEGLRTSMQMKDGTQRFAGIARPKDGEWHVVTSQTCDIAAAEDVEPFVELARAFVTNNPRTVEEARASVRRHLLDPGRGLIVDLAAPRAYIEKRALQAFRPEVGAPTEEAERAFAQWLSRRSKRVALPDDFVEYVYAPMRRWLFDTELAVDGGTSPYRRLVGLRMALLQTNASPYAVRIIAVLPPDLIPRSNRANQFQIELAEFFGRMGRGIASEHLSGLDFRARRLAEVSAQDYVNSFEIEF